jgi:hypothetical protein
MRAVTFFMSAFACARVTPGFRRPHHEQPVEVVVHLLGRERERQVQLVLQAVGRTRCQDADHRVRAAVDPDRTPYDPAVAGKSIHPELVSEDDDLVPAGRSLLAREVPAKLEAVSHHGQESRRGQGRRHLLRALVAREVHAPARERIETLERGRLLLPL